MSLGSVVLLSLIAAMPTDENDLQKEYKSLLAAIDPLVYQLKNPKGN